MDNNTIVNPVEQIEIFEQDQKGIFEFDNIQLRVP
jgi:hypothetical protein